MAMFQTLRRVQSNLRHRAAGNAAMLRAATWHFAYYSFPMAFRHPITVVPLHFSQ